MDSDKDTEGRPHKIFPHNDSHYLNSSRPLRSILNKNKWRPESQSKKSKSQQKPVDIDEMQKTFIEEFNTLSVSDNEDKSLYGSNHDLKKTGLDLSIVDAASVNKIFDDKKLCKNLTKANTRSNKNTTKLLDFTIDEPYHKSSIEQYLDEPDQIQDVLDPGQRSFSITWQDLDANTSRQQRILKKLETPLENFNLVDDNNNNNNGNTDLTDALNFVTCFDNPSEKERKNRELAMMRCLAVKFLDDKLIKKFETAICKSQKIQSMTSDKIVQCRAVGTPKLKDLKEKDQVSQSYQKKIDAMQKKLEKIEKCPETKRPPEKSLKTKSQSNKREKKRLLIQKQKEMKPKIEEKQIQIEPKSEKKKRPEKNLIRSKKDKSRIPNHVTYVSMRDQQKSRAVRKSRKAE